MPDWITHIAVAYLITLLFGIRRYRSLVLFGALIPDISKSFIPFLILGFDDGNLNNFFAPFHTVFGVLLTSALTSTFFKLQWRRACFLILIGAGSHLLLDILVWPYGSKIWSFWPLLTIQGEVGFIWPDSILPAVISSLICVIVLSAKKILRRKAE